MGIYDLIYDYFINHIWKSESLTAITHDISGVNMSMDIWLSHTSTIIVLTLLVVVLGIFVKWLFGIFASLFSFR